MTTAPHPFDRLGDDVYERLPENFPAERVALVDLLDRVLAQGVVVTGDITLSIADVDLVTVSLRAILASVSALTRPEETGPQEER